LGRLTGIINEESVRLAVERKSGAHKGKSSERRAQSTEHDVEIALANIEKAQLAPEF
jgi:hypothetical protein